MLYSEIIAVCSQIHTKHINTLCGQNVELFTIRPCRLVNDKSGVTFLNLAQKPVYDEAECGGGGGSNLMGCKAVLFVK
jgi:hypothetical protein